MQKFKLFYEDAKKLMELFDEIPDWDREDIEDHLRGRTEEQRLENWKFRRTFVSKLSWSIPCKEAIDAIRKYARPPLYDLMAGSGYWSKILNDRGIKTIASDINVGKRHNNYGHTMLAKVQRKNAYKVAGSTIRRSKEGFGDVLLAWPPYNEPVGNTIIKLIPVGSRVFYFGEGRGGCTGDDEMHCRLYEDFKELDIISLPQWEGMHDDLYIYEKLQDDYDHPEDYDPLKNF